ncbi:ornithine decarboxylase 1-like [Phlebotomus papatasi]|uniref:ornithine decarboxylase 1-like n=1 Tax=Phlebotomus papatasi TaxID=29031 RepID=UPI0024845545|nr:ornithine decarboxylase 1-like [Phlebotomus papatasi]
MKLQMENGITLFEGKFNADAIFRQKICEEKEVGQDEALYLCNLSDVARKYDIWRQKMPRVKPFYAVKCNMDENVIRMMAKLGMGFDCSSIEEFKVVLKCGVTPDRIIYAHPYKAVSHLRYSAANNIDVMTFDSMEELEKIRLVFPRAKLVLRIRCDAEKAYAPIGDKFGCDPELESRQLLTKAKNLGLSVIEISFHVGSGCEDPPSFRKAIAAARNLFDYAATLGYRMTLLDIGGGFPGETGSDIGVIADVVNTALEDHFPPGHDNVKIIAEPGRFFVSSAFTLGATIHSKKQLLDTDGNVYHVKYIINDGVHGTFNFLLYGIPLGSCYALHRKAFDKKVIKDSLVQSSLLGPTCNGFDKMSENMVLPHLDIGDIIVFPNMGAYTVSLSSTFNGFPKPRIMYYQELRDSIDPDPVINISEKKTLKCPNGNLFQRFKRSFQKDDRPAFYVY